ncbi:hypothetical protein EFP6CTSP_20100, partial [Enterococcus faecium]
LTSRQTIDIICQWKDVRTDLLMVIDSCTIMVKNSPYRFEYPDSGSEPVTMPNTEVKLLSADCSEGLPLVRVGVATLKLSMEV